MKRACVPLISVREARWTVGVPVLLVEQRRRGSCGLRIVDVDFEQLDLGRVQRRQVRLDHHADLVEQFDQTENRELAN